jgi:flagellar hook-associated protein 1 FlgK
MQVSTILGDQIESYLDMSSAELKMTAGNMANVSTPGYTEEIVEWQETAPLQIDGMTVGTGVADIGAVSQRDRVLNQALDQQTQSEASSAARLTALDNLQATFAAATSTATGVGAEASITTGLSNFFGSLQQLEASPSDPSLREAVLSAANSLSASFNTAASSLAQQQSSLNGEVAANVTQVNSLTSAIAGLNKQIQSTSPEGDAGPLEDQRQYDLQSLSKLIGIQQITTERNGVTVTTAGGVPLVLGSESDALSTSQSDGVTHVYAATNGGTTDLTTQLASGEGEIGGLLQARDGDITGALASLDTLANSVATAVNAANENGSDANGNPGAAIFSLPSTTTGSALQISVAMTDPSQIAAAATGAGVGDGSNAAVMAALAQQSIVHGQDPADYLGGFVSSLGDLTSNVNASNSAQQASVTQLQNQQSNLSTVSLDTEATNLQNLEQAYQAASKVFTILNTLIGSAINLGTETTV